MSNIKPVSFKPGDRVLATIFKDGSMFHESGVVLERLDLNERDEPVYKVQLVERRGVRVTNVRQALLRKRKENIFKPGDRVCVGQETNGHWYGTVQSLGEGYAGEYTYNILFENGTFAGEIREFAEKFISLAKKEMDEEVLHLFVDKFDGRWFYGNVVFTTEKNILVRKDSGEETLIVKDRFQLFQKVSL